MDLQITEIASQLATRLPTGAASLKETISDWRTTIYNAKATASLRPLADLIKRKMPDDAFAERVSDALRGRNS